MPLSKYFEPAEHEEAIYRRWEESGAFVADRDSDRPAFTISMPPPNATGTLHLGHAVMLAVEDLIIRYRRMAGYEALWLPGTDHAAISTESVVIKKLRDEGMDDPRAELGREELVRRIAEFTSESRGTIRRQIRAMGSSCDWSRERYTMDPQLNRCVNGVFASMFRSGLIYRGLRIVNWDPALQTTVSDDELYHQERKAKFYTLRYGPFEVGTSRPETKLGDTAVAVHPDDERWSEHVGKTYEIPWPKGPTITVRVVADPEVDPEIGTGVVGVTPAHSQVDFEIADRHHLPMVQVIGEDGRMTAAAGPYAGMGVVECREAFVADLEAAGLLVGVEEYTQPTSLCYRSKEPVEPLLKEQWFIDVNKPAVSWHGRLLSLRQVLHEAVASGEIEILPKHQEKTYFHWIDNLRDWCISRQIWWGHRVPVFYRGEEDVYCGHRPPEGEGWVQDPDTLDTWFSSALWTWSTLVDPELAADPDRTLAQLLEASPDYRRFHPTQVMETGYDILFFWVARMILMTTYATGRIPFEKVYLHGLILDRDGEKMSKSKPETSIDPIDTIGEHGADALRLALVVGSSPGQDLKLSEERITGFKRLMNKLWNAGKLVESRLGGEPPESLELRLDPDAIEHPLNRWFLHRVDELVRNTTRRLEELQLGDAGERLRIAFWGELCDDYLEMIKIDPLREMTETRATLIHGFSAYLKLFHPYMPFITEQLWSQLGFEGLLIEAPWPETVASEEWAAEVEGVEAAVRLITAVRRLRADQNVQPGAKVELELRLIQHREVLESCLPVVERMVGAESVEVVSELSADPLRSAIEVDPAFEVAMSLSEADRAAEAKRLEKELESLQGQLQGVEKTLGNPKFVERARPDVVEDTRKRRADLERMIESLRERLAETAPSAKG